ncbi:MAG: sigma 54-interacting transcriptional regulator [bacterium]
MQVTENKQNGRNNELSFTGSTAFLEKFRQLAESMQRHKTILITGESGTGKTSLAKFLCHHSPWYNKKIRTVRLDEIPDDQIEKELFGYKDGFDGRIKAADEGTIILKDVTHLPRHLQAKFLRLLEENEFERIGDAAVVKVNLRTICITGENLFQAVLENKFRKDLYYKLSALEIALPPLRNRPEDIESISLHYLNGTALQHRKNVDRLGQDALKALQNYDWPGNVRELKAEIEQAVSKLAPEKQILEANDLSPKVRFNFPQAKTPSNNLAEKMKLIERQMIIEAIEHNHGNKARTAKYLGLKHRTLYEKMKTLNIPLGVYKPHI